MRITQTILDKLTVEAKASERLRMNMDLRDSSEDGSQRMLNAIEPGSILPIHRHQKTYLNGYVPIRLSLSLEVLMWL